MNAQTENKRPDMQAQVLDLVPAVERLLERVSRSEPYRYHKENGEVRLATGLTFDDGVGNGELVAKVHTYRDSLRVDFTVEHDREFAAPGGGASGIRCFLNDYVASVTVSPGTKVIPADFQRSVVAGVAAATSAVSRHNRLHPEPWFKVKVAARDSTWASLMRDML